MPFEFDSPNYTQTPNQFFDFLLARIDSMAELKVTLAVFRFTFGFHRVEAEMSLTFLEQATGMSRVSVIDGLRRAIERGTITRNSRTSRVRLNVAPGSLDALLAGGKASKPKMVKHLNPRNKKDNSSVYKERERRASITGLMAAWRKEKEGD